MYTRPEEPTTMNESPTIITRTINTDIPDNILEAAWIVAVALHRKWHLKTPLIRLVKAPEEKQETERVG